MSNPLQWLSVAWDFVFKVGKRWYFGGIGDLAAGVTFWILLTLPAAVLAMVSGLGSVEGILGQDLSADVRGDIVQFAQQVLSSENESIENAIDQLFDRQNSGLLTFSILLSFWSISRGFSGLIRALDDVYEVEHGRAWYYTRVVALVLGLGSLLISIPIVLLQLFVWSNVDWAIEGYLRTLAAILILVFWASMIFHFGPSIRTKFRWDLPGAIVAASFWWALTEGFRYYVGVTTGRNEVLSTVGASLLALTWVWLAAQVLLIGAAVNIELGERFGLDRKPRDWKIPEAFRTGEMKKIVVDDD